MDCDLDAFIKSAFAEARDDFVFDDEFRRGVGERTLKAVAHLNPHRSIFLKNQEDDAVVLPLPTDLPGLSETHGKIIEHFSIKAGESYHDDLIGGFFFETAEFFFQLGLFGLRKHPRIIGDTALGAGRNVERQKDGAKEDYPEDQKRRKPA